MNGNEKALDILFQSDEVFTYTNRICWNTKYKTFLTKKKRDE